MRWKNKKKKTGEWRWKTNILARFTPDLLKSRQFQVSLFHAKHSSAGFVLMHRASIFFYYQKHSDCYYWANVWKKKCARIKFIIRTLCAMNTMLEFRWWRIVCAWKETLLLTIPAAFLLVHSSVALQSKEKYESIFIQFWSKYLHCSMCTTNNKLLTKATR